MTSLIEQLLSMSTRTSIPKSPRVQKDSIGIPSGPTSTVCFIGFSCWWTSVRGGVFQRSFDWKVLSKGIMISSPVEQLLEVFFPSFDNLVLPEQQDSILVFHKESLVTLSFRFVLSFGPTLLFLLSLLSTQFIVEVFTRLLIGLSHFRLRLLFAEFVTAFNLHRVKLLPFSECCSFLLHCRFNCLNPPPGFLG